MQVEVRINAPVIASGNEIPCEIVFRPQDGAASDSINVLTCVAHVNGYFTPGDGMRPEILELAPNFDQTEGSQTFLSGVYNGIRQIVQATEGTPDKKHLTFFSTDQTLLFVDKRISEKISFPYRFSMPENVPSTYRSRAASVSYSLSVIFQSLDSKNVPVSSHLELPFRLYSHSSDPPFDLADPESGMKEQVSPDIDALLNVPEATETPQQEPEAHPKVSFELTKAKEPLASLNLAWPAVSPGGILVGSISFKVPCMHLAVYLELKEEVPAEFAVNAPRSYQIFAKQHIGVYGLETVALKLQVPMVASPALNLKQLSTSWSLRVELVSLKSKVPFTQGTQSLVANQNAETEFISCRVPIQVGAPENGGHSPAKVWTFS